MLKSAEKFGGSTVIYQWVLDRNWNILDHHKYGREEFKLSIVTEKFLNRNYLLIE